MANLIKPFATNADASVMSDAELANAPELKSGFITKSKADSRLIGKLIQNTTAVSYAVGEFISANASVDVNPASPQAIASNLSVAMQKFVSDNAPQTDISGLQTKAAAKTEHDAISSEVEKKLDSTAASTLYETKTNVNSAIETLSTSVNTELNKKLASSTYNADKATFATKSELSVKLDQATYTADKPTFATKIELNSKLSVDSYNTDKATFATKSELTSQNDSLQTKISAKADSTSVYTKSEIDGKLTGTYHFKGSVESYANLPTANIEVGDTYNVKTAYASLNIKAGDNVSWTGTEWDVLSGLVDLSAYSTTEQADAKYGTIAGVNSKLSIDTYNTDKATFATKTELTSKADLSHTHTISDVTDLQTALDGKQAAGNYQPAGDYATNAAVNAKININGHRGLIAGYETVGTVATITGDSPDTNETAAAVSVANGAANQCWTKVVHCTAASPSVSLGTSWSWQNGSSPELKQNGFLVLCWCNTMGLAIYNNVQ